MAYGSYVLFWYLSFLHYERIYLNCGRFPTHTPSTVCVNTLSQFKVVCKCITVTRQIYTLRRNPNSVCHKTLKMKKKYNAIIYFRLRVTLLCCKYINFYYLIRFDDSLFHCFGHCSGTIQKTSICYNYVSWVCLIRCVSTIHFSIILI